MPLTGIPASTAKISRAFLLAVQKWVAHVSGMKPSKWEAMRDLSDDLRKIELIKSRNHYRNFLDSVRSRQPTITPAERAPHSAIPGHLAMMTGRKIK